MNKTILMGVATMCFVSRLLADSVVVNADAADQQINNPGAMVWVSQPTAQTGSSVTDASTCAYVIPFKLPDIDGKAMTNVQLNVYLVKGYPYGAPQETYVDVYGGRVAAGSVVVSNDWNVANAIGDNIAKISKDAETSNTVKSVTLTASFFQDIYKNDAAAAGKYIFLTLRPDVAPLTRSATVTWATANDAKAENRPTLIITTK